MHRYTKKSFPVENIRRFIEPGPVVLVSSRWKGKRNIMTMGWHMVMEFSPSLIGCYIWRQNQSFEMIRQSKQCVINIPTADMAETVVGIGNISGREVDKFDAFNLTAGLSNAVEAPSIEECYANLECRLIDKTLIKRYSLFIFEVVAARAAQRPANPKTIHYRGNGQFMVSGHALNLRRKFKPEML
jgi:flavin reductase (DIM6/NTAB) family NADH-FMN oxidoreductase RutF